MQKKYNKITFNNSQFSICIDKRKLIFIYLQINFLIPRITYFVILLFIIINNLLLICYVSENQPLPTSMP